MSRGNVEETDVLVVGAGPTGLIAGREAARRGVNVTVLEEHEEIGVPCHCAGLLSIRGLKEIGVEPSDEFVQNEVSGAVFHSPSDLTFEIRGREKMTYVVDRVTFDKALARQAVSAGVELRLGFKAERFLMKKGVVSGVVGENKETIRAKVVIDAEGSGCRLLKMVDFEKPNPEGFLQATQLEVAEVKPDSDLVEIFVGSMVAPKFFLWVIPTGADSARVGLACKDRKRYNLLKNFVENKLGKHRTTAVRAGCVITSGPSARTCHDGVIIVGDAAGQTKPTTGGGVVTGGICASIAGEVAAEAVLKDDPSAGFLRKYEDLWRRRLGREFSLMLLARKILNRLSDDTIDGIFKEIVKSRLQGAIEEEGDIDFQSKVLRRLARQPPLLKILLRVAGDILFKKPG